MLCTKCGGVGKLRDGSICECSLTSELYIQMYESLSIPEHYQGVEFNYSMLPRKNGYDTNSKMQGVFETITSGSKKHSAYLICTEANGGKEVLAYTLIRKLFEQGKRVLTLYDLLEMKTLVQNYDYGKIDKTNDCLYSSPYLFAIVPPLLVPSVFETASLLLTRRVRNGNTTVFLFSGKYDQIQKADKDRVFTQYLGDGSKNSFILIGGK